jgi:NAD(P)-dependent dehydrogenase (short-subunit alcohol dehydrogenase family)
MSPRNKTAIATGAAADGRFGTAEETATTAPYRVSLSAEFVTGMAVAMDGGLSL